MKKTSLIVAYFLSKYDRAAYELLGFPGRQKGRAHAEIGAALDVNPNTLKNRRDDFDPLHTHRAGWHQYELSGPMRQVVQELCELTIEELFAVVQMILQGRLTEDNPLILAGDTDQDSGVVLPESSTRGLTGARAEDLFQKLFAANKLPFSGTLEDKTKHGCGYDFRIDSDQGSIYVEVKGLDAALGGVMLTCKEWEVAKKLGNDFYLVLIRDIGGEPEVVVVKDPHTNLRARESVYRPVQVRYLVSQKDIEGSGEVVPIRQAP